MYSLLILVPFFSIIILNLPVKLGFRRLAFCWAFVLSIAQVFLVIFHNPRFWSRGSDVFGAFFKFHLAVDNLSIVLLFCIGMVLFTVLLVARYIIKDEERMFSFVNLLLLALAGMNAIATVTDIFSLYVFLEVTAVSSFILIAFYKKIDALEAAFKYAVMSIVATILMLSAIALLLLVAGDTSFSSLRDALAASRHSAFIMFSIGIFLCGLFIKAGLMPFHGWLPDAYTQAPAPVSVLLSGVATKAVGMYALMRMVNSVFGFDHPLKNVLLCVGAASVVIGALAALRQSDFKRMLAYSSISQMGYIIIGLGCGSPLGFIGALFHFFNHAIFKSLLFVNAAAVELQAGTRDMDDLSGLASKMPFTGATSLLACLSCAGIPPLAGFWSKLIIIIALWQGGYYAFAVIAVLASLITLAYLLSLQRRVFFGQIKGELIDIKEAGWELILPSLILALITLGIGIIFPWIAARLGV